jgi:hypothetical protein
MFKIILESYKLTILDKKMPSPQAEVDSVPRSLMELPLVDSEVEHHLSEVINTLYS